MKWWKVFILISVVILLMGFGLYIAVRALTPLGISYDPDDTGYCEIYGIEIDATQVETIYRSPESILADPEAFLLSDHATLMLSKHHFETNEPLDVKRWTKQVRRVNNLALVERNQKQPYKVTNDVLTGKETWCKITVPHVQSYLPEGTDIGTTFYLAAFDTVVPAVTIWERVVMCLSHPMHKETDKFFNTGSATLFNMMAHELFHVGYNAVELHQTEIPHQNSAVQSLMTKLQNEGMAVNAAYRLKELYPSPMEIYPFLKMKPYVRYLIGRVNKIFSQAESKPVGRLTQDVHRFYRFNSHYIVGGYMAGRIEDQLGKEALVTALEIGPREFIRAYNSVVEEEMELHLIESDEIPESPYLELRRAATEGDYTSVREYLDVIKVSKTSGDVEFDGNMLYKTGYILLYQDQLDLAGEAFQVLISKYPHVGSAYVGFADVYVQKGNVSSAIEYYEKAMEIEPRFQWLKVIIDELGDGQD